ncbi:helix-turn-helix domain-containing protein [uncultured Modestobacter sp.]|uniref:helix-turn-helix domain-containing protein n=1 Tax=uncultured Modestobacter sp. TaxID=380048 RepID=UPI002602CBF4|nr:helix-turn-helix domain-containing protein [uncultured Modestobacter sp.]
MEQAVADVAAQLGVHESRIRMMLRSGRLSGRKVGPVWLVDSAEVQRAVREKAPSGRPLNPAQAWGVLDLLDGGHASWLDVAGRSRARGHARGLAGADASRWRAALRRRHQRVPCRVHAAALSRLLDAPGVIPAGADRAAAAGADLLVISSVPEAYVSAVEWPDLARRLAIRQDVAEPNLIVRVPADVWPFAADEPQPSLVMLAADLLDSSEPRAISAGVGALNAAAARIPPSRRR